MLVSFAALSLNVTPVDHELPTFCCRSTTNRVSLLELSVQVRTELLPERPATRFDGAAGAVGEGAFPPVARMLKVPDAPAYPATRIR